jgi:hypothetical protein
MTDPTEEARRHLVCAINNDPQIREALAERYGSVWDTAELTRDFDVVGFAAPFVVATRKSDKIKGSLQFQHHPRLYYDFRPDASR